MDSNNTSNAGSQSYTFTMTTNSSEQWPDDDGTAGVREPRNPTPSAPAGTMAMTLAYSGS